MIQGLSRAAVGAGGTGCSPLEAVFSGIYQNNSWGSTETRSGPGSTVARTAGVRRLLHLVIEEFAVRTLLDAPCGDFNWMKEVPLERTRYIGIDVVAELIEENRRRFGRAGREFLHLDLTADTLPRADLIFCRDCLVHFSFADIRRALTRFRRSGSSYLLTTTFRARGSNDDIDTGGWRPLNLEAAPFCLPPPLRSFSDGCPHPAYADKALALWSVRQLSRADSAQ